MAALSSISSGVGSGSVIKSVIGQRLKTGSTLSFCLGFYSSLALSLYGLLGWLLF